MYAYTYENDISKHFEWMNSQKFAHKESRWGTKSTEYHMQLLSYMYIKQVRRRFIFIVHFEMFKFIDFL